MMLGAAITWNGLNVNNRAARLNLAGSPYYAFWTKRAQWVLGSKSVEWPKPRTEGDYPSPTYVGNLRLNLSGALVALNGITLQTGQRALEQACWDHGYHNLVFQEMGEPQLRCTMKVSQDPDWEKVVKKLNAWELDFTFQLLASDPLFYEVSGGAVYPSWRSS